MKITKSSVAMVVLIVWAVFSAAYIGWSSWKNFTTNQMRTAANQGYAQAILDIGAAVEKCQQVPLTLGEDKTVNIVSVDCLKQPSAPAPAAPEIPKK
jgi:C4-dicarboxylate-specific signal transduction histidine kinase